MREESGREQGAEITLQSCKVKEGLKLFNLKVFWFFFYPKEMVSALKFFMSSFFTCWKRKIQR